VIILFDTVRRHKPVREAGELVAVRWESKELLRTIPLFPDEPAIDDDPNPRGNSRGGKGIAARGDEIFVGTYHTVLVFDRNLDLRRRITNNLFVNVHEIHPVAEGLWVSSTAIDCALLVDAAGRTLRTFWPREQPLLTERFGLTPLTLDKAADNRLLHLHKLRSTERHHTHLNAVFGRDSAVYVLLNAQGAVVRIEPDVAVVLEDPGLVSAHSPAFLGDGRLAICSSIRRQVLVADLSSGKIVDRLDLTEFAEVRRIMAAAPDRPFNRSIFARGLAPLADGRVLVGISPAAILEVDLARRELLDVYRHSREVEDAVHGLAVLREDPAPAGGR
jgi:hypothetical protein